MAGEADAFVLLILACIFPPAAAAFVAGCGADLCLNILLTILGYLPGCIHAFWLVLKRAEANETYGYKNWIYTGRGEYLPYDQRPPSASYGKAQAQAPPPPPPPPPPGQYPAGKAPLPGEAPVGQTPGGYGYAPGPADQKYQAPPQVPVDQKAVEVVPHDQKPAMSTAQTQTTAFPSGT